MKQFMTTCIIVVFGVTVLIKGTKSYGSASSSGSDSSSFSSSYGSDSSSGSDSSGFGSSYGSDSSSGSDSNCGSSSEIPTCDEGWEEYNGHCYLFSTGFLFWQDAKASCEAYGSTLVKIEDSAENTWIISRITANDLESKHPWIGAEDLDRDRIWRWIDGEALTYTGWAPLEPYDNAECAGFLFTRGWNDRACARNASFICEKLL